MNPFLSCFRKVSLLVILFSFTQIAFAQNAYQKGWLALNNANVEEAIKHFENARKNNSLKEKSLLCLSLLYSQNNKLQEASESFEEYYKIAADPHPALYAMWFEEGVIGQTGRKKERQLARLKALSNEAALQGKLDGGVLYRLGTHYVMSFDKANAVKNFEQIKGIQDWALLGPFDNVMNSGFDKDFGVVAHPESNYKFSSKYGAEVSWFDPPVSTYDAYFFKDMYFLSDNSLVYAQTFVESPAEQEVYVKFGYSGSFKVWINDSLIYFEPENRDTEMDYYVFKTVLNKGYNRILLQLGDHDESYASFTFRITDAQHKPVLLAQKNTAQAYEKKLTRVEEVPFFAVKELQSLSEKDNDPLYKVLLAKAFMRSKELHEAEDILISMYKENPKNYFALRNLILTYSKAGDNTNQSRFYELFKEAYPNDINILSNNIDEYKEEGNKEKIRKAIADYLSKYPDEYNRMSYDIVLADLNNDNNRVLELVDSLYLVYPDDYTAVSTKYEILKSYYSRPAEANKLLEDYLTNYYDYNILMELVNNYINEGKMNMAMELLEKNIELVPYSIESYRYIINLLARQNKYEEAIIVCNKILENKPSDYQTLNDLATLHEYINEKKKAAAFYDEALRYFPFSFDINESKRELLGQKFAVDLVPEIDPVDIIKSYEKNFKPTVKKSYDIVLSSKSFIIFKYKATGHVQRFIIKINDENAIKQWQKINLNTGYNYELFINEARTIKKTGEKVDGERNNGEVVFTNLEVGDYLYVYYTEKQVNGGKSSMFISDRFSLNSKYPAYKIDYTLLIEEGLAFRDTMINGNMKPQVTKKQGFNIYTWSTTSPEIIKDESYSLAFNDIAQKIHISLDYTWNDIVQWYGDLSTYQAAPDYTIKEITRELFDGKSYSDDEKAKIIYDFVCKNIQYSSIDFRQSQYVPQKASKVYHSRLGDCKDVSTLYVSLARAAGLKANLVLINTSDNGQYDVILPSLYFNHCIVKVYLNSGARYLELTDPNLAYGHLDYVHKNAAILEIPSTGNFNNIKLERLDFTSNNEVIRNAYLEISEDYKMKLNQKVIKTGTEASSTCKSYYYIDEEDKKDKLKKAIAPKFKSSVMIDHLKYDLLEPRKDSVLYSYGYMVDNDILKLGSFRSFKIPFSDVLVTMNIFEESKRSTPFNFIYYEDVDRYDESIEITIPQNFVLTEIPENIHLEYKGSTYDLEFQKLNDSKLKVHRIYKVNRSYITPDEFMAFKDFMTKINEAENTNLLFK